MLEDRFASAALEDRFASATLEDRFASAALEDRSLTLTRRTSRHSVPIFKGSARSSNEVIFKQSDLQGLCPIFKPKAIRTAPLVRLEQPKAIRTAPLVRLEQAESV